MVRNRIVQSSHTLPDYQQYSIIVTRRYTGIHSNMMVENIDNHINTIGTDITVSIIDC